MTDGPQTNGYDPEELFGFVCRVQTVQLEIDRIMAAAREEASPLRDDIAAIKREAADAGVQKTEFAAVLKKRRLEARIDEIPSKFDLEQRANYEAMIESLERLADELPGLGEAARDQARAAHG